MSNALANVYSFGNKLRNNLKALLTDPANHLASQANIWAADMNRALDSPATAYRRAGGVMADDPSTVAAANLEQERMTNALMGTAPGFVGMTAWHGSPHKFDRFDSSKIGTGEGNQIYGHGLYLAEHPKVAKAYATDLLSQKAVDSGQLKLARGNVDFNDLYAQANNVPSKLNDFRKDFRELVKIGHLQKSDYDDFMRVATDLIESRGGGNFYKVDLPDEMVARMLDWDKPLSQQSPDVQKAISAIAPTNKAGQSMVDLDATGGELIRALGIGDGASSLLRQQGIPGVRYLDGGSRGKTGNGTSNFVIFPGEENALRILERNGMTLADMAGQSGKIDSRLLAALGLGGAAAVAGNALLNNGKTKLENARKARQQAIEQAEADSGK